MSSNLDKGSAKILVLGDSGVGKSSLIHLICHSTVLSSAKWSIGCSIDVKLHDNYFLEFWDIGGSRSHKIARSFLYQDYHGIMLVFDATNNKSRVNLDEWLKEVTQRNGEKDLDTFVNSNVPIITIATKKDLLPYGSVLEGSESPTTNYKDRYCSVVNFNENPETNYPIRRQLSSSSTQSSSWQMFSSSVDLLSSHSSSRNSSMSSQANEPLLRNQVIYVNTQDVLSFSANPQSYEKLNNFFRRVIDRRNRRV